MGALVSRDQLDQVTAGVTQLCSQADLIHDGAAQALVDADPSGGRLLSVRRCSERASRIGASLVHEVEVFGPVATLIAYRDLEHAVDLVRRGGGSLVTSLYGTDPGGLGAAALELADAHGRIHVISPPVADAHTGHGNVMPQSLHGGPGRAGGGEELGGLRALAFYHQRAAIQAETAVLDRLGCAPLTL